MIHAAYYRHIFFILFSKEKLLEASLSHYEHRPAENKL